MCESKKLCELLQSLREEVVSEVRYNAFIKLLIRIQTRKLLELREKQSDKLIRIHGSPILMKQQKDSVVNLSSIEIDNEMTNILSLGLNCHLKQKFDRTKRKVEIELLYEDIKETEKSKKLCISNEDDFKCELERFGTKAVQDHTKDILSREQYEKIKSFNSNASIITRKADKSNIH